MDGPHESIRDDSLGFAVSNATAGPAAQPRHVGRHPTDRGHLARSGPPRCRRPHAPPYDNPTPTAEGRRRRPGSPRQAPDRFLRIDPSGTRWYDRLGRQWVIAVGASGFAGSPVHTAIAWAGRDKTMKTLSLSTALSPGVIVMGALAAAVLLIVLTGAKVPLLSNIRVSLIVLLVLGMAICAQGGIGPVAAANQWTHPNAIIGYVLGLLILVTAISAWAGFTLPYAQNDRQAFVAMAILMVAKVLNTVIHSLISARA